MSDFLLFRRMLTPILIQIIFWIFVLVFIYQGVYSIASGRGILNGLGILIGGPIAARLSAEFVILFFRINETLTDISHEILGKNACDRKTTLIRHNDNVQP